MQIQKIDHSRRELLGNIGLTALIVFGLGTLAKADETVPAEYQGVWAAARNCNDNFQNVVSDAVNRKLAACRVTQVVSSGDPESHTSTVSLNCGGLQSREIWHDESSDGADYLVIVQLEQGAAAGRPSIVTPRYIHKLFESEGVSFSEYLLDRRLCAAHRSLTNRRLAARSIASVAFDSGFADLSYFNRTFRRRYNATPTEVRSSGAD